MGRWGSRVALLAGQPLPPDLIKTISLYIDEKVYSVQVGDQIDKGTDHDPPDVSPMQIDIVGTEGPTRAKTILAIFEQSDANTLVVCYGSLSRSSIRVRINAREWLLSCQVSTQSIELVGN